MIRKPKPKTFSPETQAAILEASAKQTGKSVTPKSYDPLNFPVFENPINQKILVYVPNHTVPQPDGSIAMRMDKFAAHACLDGRQFATVRCASGIVDETNGLDGTCPLCNSMNEVWELYKKEYADIANAKGIDPESPEAKQLLKQDRVDLLNKQVISSPEVWMVFPVVVIECLEKDGKLTVTPKTNSENQITGKPMWYAIREKTYKDKWESAFDGVSTSDGELPTSPAGFWAILNYTYQSETGKYDKMTSAKNLKVTYKEMPGYEQWATYFDQLTEEWTPIKSMETVIMSAYRDMDELTEVADSLMMNTRAKLSLYAMHDTGAIQGGAPAVTGKTNADQTLANFGATPVADDGAEGATGGAAGAAPVQMGEMPNTGVE